MASHQRHGIDGVGLQLRLRWQCECDCGGGEVATHQSPQEYAHEARHCLQLREWVAQAHPIDVAVIGRLVLSGCSLDRSHA